jgi:hypothetical protein
MSPVERSFGGLWKLWKMLNSGPILQRVDRLDWANRPQSASELAALWKYIHRGKPCGRLRGKTPR